MFHGNYSAQVDAGSMQLYVRYIGTSHDERSQFRYRVEEILTEDQRKAGKHADCYTGDDLYSGVHATVTSQAMLATLAAFLTSAGEAYMVNGLQPYTLDHDAPDFPAWLQELAYINSDELASVEMEYDAPQY